MLGDFSVENAKIGRKSALTENCLSTNEMWCAVNNHNHMCHVCAQGFLDSNFH